MSHPTAQAGYSNGVALGATIGRPRTLITTLGLAVLTAVAGVIDQILFIGGAHDIAVNSLNEQAGDSIAALRDLGGDAFVDEAVNEAVSSLHSRAYAGIVLAALLVVFALLVMGKAATWTRVLTTIVAVLVAGEGIRELTDIGTGLVRGLGGLTALLAVLTLVMVWMPANGRYAKAVKARKAA